MVGDGQPGTSDADHPVYGTGRFHISLSPSPPPIFPQPTGQAQFFLAPVNTPFLPNPPPIDVGDIGTLTPGTSFHAQFSPTDPCLGDGTCQLGFSFAGLTAGPGSNLGPFGTAAYGVDVILGLLPSAAPNPPPILPIGSFDLSDVLQPTPPPIHGNGKLVVFDDPELIGTWQATMSAVAVPEPSSVVLLATGLLGLLGWRRHSRETERC